MWTECNGSKTRITNGVAVMEFRRHVDQLRALLALNYQRMCGRDVESLDAAVAALDSIAFSGWRSVREAVRS